MAETEMVQQVVGFIFSPDCKIAGRDNSDRCILSAKKAATCIEWSDQVAIRPSSSFTNRSTSLLHAHS